MNERSIEGAATSYPQPVKNDARRLSFYALYEKHLAQSRVNKIKRHKWELKYALIFVRHLGCTPEDYLTFYRRSVTSLLSPLFSSPAPVRSPGQIRTWSFNPTSVSSLPPSTLLGSYP